MSETEAVHRLLVCKSCAVLYKLPPYDGPPEYDMALIDIIDRHLQRADDPRPESHISLIFRTDEATASKLDVETALKKELADNDLFIKEFRDDLKDDAMACFNRHQRPSNGCPDYGDSSKVIGRTHGVPPEKRQYLCMYCPAQEYVTHKLRIAKHMY